MMFKTKIMGVFILTGVICLALAGQNAFEPTSSYVKSEYRIAMRDGTKLFTSVYVPKDTSQTYPILMTRTPYSAGPYGATSYREPLGPSGGFEKEGYIFVFQD